MNHGISLWKKFRQFARHGRTRFSAQIILLSFGIALQVTAAHAVPPRSYVQFLNTLANENAQQRIEQLQSFIRENPKEERAFLKLLECYRAEHQTSQAKAYFQQLADMPATQRNSFWMLAKLTACDSLVQTRTQALAAFAKALQDSETPPSPPLLYDFVEFCYVNADHAKLAQLGPLLLRRAEAQALAFGFEDYFNEKFQAAEIKLRAALRPFSNHPLLLYVLSDCIARNTRKSRVLRQAQADSVSRSGYSVMEKEYDQEWQARFAVQSGDIAYDRNAYEQAQASYEKAYARAAASHELTSLQRVLGGFAKLHYMRGNYKSADSLYTLAIEIAASICAYRDLSLLHSNRCLLLSVIGNFPRALECGEASERYARLARDQEGLVRIQPRRARLYYDLGQKEYAQRLCLEARALAQERNYTRLSSRAGALLAEIYAREKNFAVARKLYDERLAYLTATGNKLEHHSIVAKKADTYRDEGESHWEQAIALYQQASQEAAADNAPYYQAYYRLDIADLETLRGHYDRVAQILEAIPSEVFTESAEGLIRLKLSWGQYYERRGEWDHAIAAYRAATALIDSTQPVLKLEHLRISYMSDRARAAQGLAECFFQRFLLRQAKTDRDSLFYYLEKGRGRTFQDEFDPNSARAKDSSASALEADYRRTCLELQRLQRHLRLHPENYDSLRTRYEILRHTVVYQRPQLRSPKTILPNHDLAGPNQLTQVQNILRQSNSALLLYHISENAPFVVAVSAEDFRALPLHTTRAEITTLCDTLMAPFRSAALHAEAVPLLPFRAEVAHQLYALLFKPAEEAMNLPQQIIIVPDAALAALPFEMLLTKTPARTAYAPTDSAAYAPDFLLHRYAFTYSPSFGLIQKNWHARTPTRGALVLANPLQHTIIIPQDTRLGLRKSALEPLPYTELEAARIEEIYAHTAKFTRTQATKSVFFDATANYRVAHFATHAFIDTVFDDFSGLVLATSKDSSDDGLLMGYEIADLDLKHDLITLSACETGKGKVADGEGVLGLPRLFLRAGAKSVLLTHWQVDDQFAAELVPQFYAHYLNEGWTKAAALAEAKRELLRDARPVRGIYQQHPFYWAAFTLYGDPGQSQKSSFAQYLVYAAIFIVLILVVLSFHLRQRKRKEHAYGSQAMA